MSIITLVLGTAVLIYLIYAAFQELSSIRELDDVNARGEIVELDGEVIGKRDEMKKSIGGQMVELCYPLYSAATGIVDGEYITCVGKIRRPNVKNGDSAVICYDKYTGTKWVKDEPELMKKAVYRRTALVAGLTLLMIAIAVIPQMTR